MNNLIRNHFSLFKKKLKKGQILQCNAFNRGHLRTFSQSKTAP